MSSIYRSMRNTTTCAAQSGASCVAMDMGLLEGRTLVVRLFVLTALEALLGLLGLLISLLLTRFKPCHC